MHIPFDYTIKMYETFTHIDLMNKYSLRICQISLFGTHNPTKWTSRKGLK